MIQKSTAIYAACRRPHLKAFCRTLFILPKDIAVFFFTLSMKAWVGTVEITSSSSCSGANNDVILSHQIRWVNKDSRVKVAGEWVPHDSG